jgi:hypothetical protein
MKTIVFGIIAALLFVGFAGATVSMEVEHTIDGGLVPVVDTTPATFTFSAEDIISDDMALFLESQGYNFTAIDEDWLVGGAVPMVAPDPSLKTTDQKYLDAGATLYNGSPYGLMPTAIGLEGNGQGVAMFNKFVAEDKESDW